MNWKKVLPIILIIIFSIIMIFSLTKIVLWYIDNRNTDNEIKNIQSIAPISEIEDSNDTNIIAESKYSSSKFINVSFDDLLNINNEVVGWIRVPGTNIDYPFVQHKNNSYYLNHSFDKTYNEAGWVFLDYRNNIDELDTNTIIYAHGRIDGTMFGSLKNILTSDWLKNKDNFILKLSTPNNNYLFEVFSIYHINTTNDYLYNRFNSYQEYNKFINLIKNRSSYNFNVDVNEQDKIVTLSTCYNSKEKMVLHAKLIKEQKRY